jgi:hypothetical protein
MRVEANYQAPGFAQELNAMVDLSIRVQQFTRLETSDFWLPHSASVGSPVMLEFSVINSGRVMIHNMRIRVEETNRDPDFPLIDTSEANMQIGEVMPSRWLMYRGQFVPLVPGFLTGDIILYGEDPSFELVEHRIPFEIYVQDGWGHDPWGNDPWGNDPWGNDPWGQEEEELGWFRRLWRWLTTPLGGYAGNRRNNNNNNQPDDMFHHFERWGDAGQNGGIEPLGRVVIPAGRPGGGMIVSPPMSPGMPGMDMWGMEEPEPDSFFIHIWNFVRMPIFLFPFGIGLGAGVTLLVIKVKKRNAEMMDFDE